MMPYDVDSPRGMSTYSIELSPQAITALEKMPEYACMTFERVIPLLALQQDDIEIDPEFNGHLDACWVDIEGQRERYRLTYLVIPRTKQVIILDISDEPTRTLFRKMIGAMLAGISERLTEEKHR